ncbi:MAG: hypothetical protein HY460_02400 [Parcubacteria group bacterium]|nr:hypothetical protein [Parcubacteria group bacterium]
MDDRRDRRSNPRRYRQDQGSHLTINFVHDIQSCTTTVTVHVSRHPRGGGLLRDRTLHWTLDGWKHPGSPRRADQGKLIVNYYGLTLGDHLFEVVDEATGRQFMRVLSITTPKTQQPEVSVLIRVLYPEKSTEGETVARAIIMVTKRDGTLARGRRIHFSLNGIEGSKSPDAPEDGITVVEFTDVNAKLGSNTVAAWDEETGVYGCAEFQVPEPTPTTVCLDLDVAYPVRDPVSSDFGALVTVYASKRPGRIELLEDRRLRLVLDGLPIPETFITKKGIVEHFLKIFQPGDHSIHVWDEETGVKASKELSLRPGKLEYGIEGYNGKYRVTFTVRDRNTGCPLPGAVIEICPEGEERKRERTSSDGTFTRDFSIGKRQFYRVRVPGAPPEEERKFWLYEDQTVRAQHREGE